MANGTYSTYATIQQLDHTGNNDAYGPHKARLKQKRMKINNINEQVTGKVQTIKGPPMLCT